MEKVIEFLEKCGFSNVIKDNHWEFTYFKNSKINILHIKIELMHDNRNYKISLSNTTETSTITSEIPYLTIFESGSILRLGTTYKNILELFRTSGTWNRQLEFIYKQYYRNEKISKL